MALQFNSGQPVQLSLLFKQTFIKLVNETDLKSILNTKKTISKKLAKSLSLGSNDTQKFRNYQQYLDSFKKSNPNFAFMTSEDFRMISIRVNNVYDRFKLIPEKIFIHWRLNNMPFIILSKNRLALPHVKTIVHYTNKTVTLENIEIALSQGKHVRLSSLPDDFDLYGFEVYGDGSIPNVNILGDYKTIINIQPNDLLNQTFNKRDPTYYTSPDLEWIAALESVVTGDRIDTMTQILNEPVVFSGSLWYAVTLQISYKIGNKIKTTSYRGNVSSPNEITVTTPYLMNKDQALAIFNNYITVENVPITLPYGIDYTMMLMKYKLISSPLLGLIAYGVTTINLLPGDEYLMIGAKGSGKTSKLRILKEIANVEDSDDYGVFLTRLLSKTHMLNSAINDIIDYSPPMNVVLPILDDFLDNEVDYEAEESFFLILTRLLINASKIVGYEHLPRKLNTYIQKIMANKYYGVSMYYEIRKKRHNPDLPTFIMCHSTAETVYRPTPTDTILISDVLNSQYIVESRGRDKYFENSAEILLYHTYIEGISTINKILPFAIILEQIRVKLGKPTFATMKID